LASELSDGGVGGAEMGQCRIVIVTGLLKIHFWNMQWNYLVFNFFEVLMMDMYLG
jgi:hypothetical protein